MIHVNFGPRIDTKHIHVRRNLELKYRKLSITKRDIVFLSKCMKCSIVPNGLRLKNPFNSQSTSVKQRIRNVCVNSEQQLRNAVIKNDYETKRDLWRDMRTDIEH